MAEPNILLTRIDNRLIHGQVATQWNSTLGSNLILVANDEVSGNTMRQNLMKMAAPAGVATRFFSLQHTIDIIAKASPKQKIFIVAETPQDVLTLVKGGVPIPAGVATRFFSLQHTIDIIAKASPKQKIFIVAETPQDVLTLVKGGVPIRKVNIGNMHMSEGKRQVATSVAVDDADVAAFKELQELGVELEIRRVPSTPVEDINKLFS